MKNFIFIALFIALQTMIPGTAHAQNLDLNQALPFDSTVVKGQLSNGLTYYIKPNAKPAQKVELRLVVAAGSILENDNQRGLAHFMEHMNFNGLQHFPKNTLEDFLQKIGVRFGADLNAYTGFDRTYYFLPIPTDKPSNLDSAFQVVADWAGGALITTQDVNDERHVILEESRLSTKNANMRMLNKYLPVWTNNSHYADRLPIGLDSIVLNADPDRIREFYHDWYRPDLQAVIVVGDITVDSAKAMIEKYFGGLKNPGNERSRTIYEIPPYTEKKAVVVTDSEATHYEFQLFFPMHKAVEDKTVGDYRNSLIKNIMISGLNRKLRDLAQTANPPYVNAGGGFDRGVSLENEQFSMGLIPTDDFTKSINAAIGVLLQLQKYGLSGTDIATSKNEILANYEKSYNERNTTESANFTDELARNFTTGEAVPGIANEYRYAKELLPTINVEDINAAIKKWLPENPNYFTYITAPTNGKIVVPEQDSLLMIVDNAFKQEAAKSVEKRQATSLLSTLPTPGKIIKETKEADLGATTYTLSNGVKVTVKSTDFKTDEIVLSGIKYGGTRRFGAADKSNTTFLSSVIASMGYGQFTPTALNDFLSGKTVQLNTGLSASDNSISGYSSVKDLPVLLQLMYLKLTSPRKDSDLFTGYITKMKSMVQSLKDNPQNAFLDSLSTVFYNNHPLKPIVIPTESDLDNINMDKILDIYKEQFGYADGLHLFFVGNIDVDSLKPLLETYIASLPVKDVTPSFKDNALRITPGTQTFKFYKGADPKSLIIDVFQGTQKYSEDANLKTNMLAQAMTIQVIDTIREKMSAIYAGSVNVSFIDVPFSRFVLQTVMPCGPENVDKILAEYNREIVEYRSVGVSSINLDKVKKAMLEKYKENLKQNGYWVNNLQSVLFWKNSKKFFLNYDKKVNTVSVGDTKKLANQFLNEKNRFTAISYPEKTGE